MTDKLLPCPFCMILSKALNECLRIIQKTENGLDFGKDEAGNNPIIHYGQVATIIKLALCDIQDLKRDLQKDKLVSASDEASALRQRIKELEADFKAYGEATNCKNWYNGLPLLPWACL